jgi:hypothetical protein
MCFESNNCINCEDCIGNNFCVNCESVQNCTDMINKTGIYKCCKCNVIHSMRYICNKIDKN